MSGTRERGERPQPRKGPAGPRGRAVPMTEIEPGPNGERRAVGELPGLSVTVRLLPPDDRG